ncbi:recombinase family protein [Halobaculum lipolyticum]|uniref:Recombinase family protein n=1 Tax=Halobaculum lipolyticum TaxID=3032001 RepID=A0ABD5WDU0_9EURY
MTVACYTRVSTAKQNLDRQLNSTQQYAEDSLGAALSDIEVYRDKSSGTKTARDAYQRLMSDAEDGANEPAISPRASGFERE